MKNVFQRLFFNRLNLWIAVGLILANLYAWATVLMAAAAPYVVAPIRDPQIEKLLDYMQSGQHSGESWQITLTELQAEQTVTWYLQRYPQIPFAHPRIKMTPDYLSVEGDATIAGLHFHGGGKARITLANGLPQVKIVDLSVPLPPPIRQALEDEIQKQMRRAEALPVRFSSAEWQNGQVVVSGTIR